MEILYYLLEKSEDMLSQWWSASNAQKETVLWVTGAGSLKISWRKRVKGYWQYQSEMDAIKLMEEKGQTYLDDSFCIFTKTHIENLKKLPTKEAA